MCLDFSKYQGGRVLSKGDFLEYVLTLKKAYEAYCDDLHPRPRSLPTTILNLVSCMWWDRPKSSSKHLFLELFGVSLDKCSPNYCAFTFDMYGYDEGACDAEAASRSATRAMGASRQALRRSRYTANVPLLEDPVTGRTKLPLSTEPWTREDPEAIMVENMSARIRRWWNSRWKTIQRRKSEVRDCPCPNDLELTQSFSFLLTCLRDGCDCRWLRMLSLLPRATRLWPLCRLCLTTGRSFLSKEGKKKPVE